MKNKSIQMLNKIALTTTKPNMSKTILTERRIELIIKKPIPYLMKSLQIQL